MAGHDDYGKRVIQKAANDAASIYGRSVEIDYGTAQPARIDATLGEIAIEVESRVSKQVRGAVLDLICHSNPKKLLILLPVHMGSPEATATQCRNILSRFIPDGSYRVVVLKGRGDNPQLLEDAMVVRAALSELNANLVTESVCA